MKLLKITAFALSAGLILWSCDKKDDADDTKTTTEEKAELSLHVNHSFGTQPFSLNTNFTLSTGEIVKFSTAQFYISGIQLMDDDQNVTSFADEYLLIDPTFTHQHIADLDVQHYHMVMLNIGVDATTNAGKQPTDFEDGHSLAPQLNNMWWSWNAGYIFYKLEGEVDRDGDGTFDDSFLYHIGTDNNIIAKQTMLHTTVVAGGELEIEMEVDYAKFLDNVNLTTELEARMMPMDLVAKIATNTSAAITFE